MLSRVAKQKEKELKLKGTIKLATAIAGLIKIAIEILKLLF